MERLTDAELDALISGYTDAEVRRAIAELRELRADHAECEAIIDSCDSHANQWKAEYNKEFDKNAKLRAALEELSNEVWPHEADAEIGAPEEGMTVAGPVRGETIIACRAALATPTDARPTVPHPWWTPEAMKDGDATSRDVLGGGA